MRAQLRWLILLFVLCYIPLFHFLAKPAIVIWDEALYANNALDMAIHKNFWVLHYNGEVCISNTKPPLVIWLQCLGIWLLGPTELPIRLPSALAAFMTCLAVFYFAKYSLKNEKIGLGAVLFLITARGIVRAHVARTGDLDAMLVCWITVYALLALHFLLHHVDNYQRLFRWIGLSIFLAFMTKSIAGLMPILGLFWPCLRWVAAVMY